MSAGESTQRDLFGGAIVASIPELFIDASDIRPVPSEQEVFVSATPATDISILIDILERVDPETEVQAEAGGEGRVDGGGATADTGLRSNNPQLQDLEACKIHFEDIIDGREGSIGRLFHIGHLKGVETKLGPATPTYLIKGTVSSPYNPAPPRDDPNYASTQHILPYSLLLMTMFRLEQVKTDLLVTVNCPVTSQQDIMHEQRVWHPAYDAPPGGKQAVPPSESQIVDDAIILAGKVVASLEIRDWGLFLPNSEG